MHSWRKLPYHFFLFAFLSNITLMLWKDLSIGWYSRISSVFPFQNILQHLDPSYKKDLEFNRSVLKEETYQTAGFLLTNLDIWGHLKV